MPQPVTPGIREVLLQEIIAQQPKTQIDPHLTQTSVLSGAARKLSGYDEQAILTQWNELFRTGLLAWGFNLSNPNPPFFHLTERGRHALSDIPRDPSNPAGYLRHLASVASLNSLAMSYLTEALDCYVGGLFKAAAVMIGAAAESVILELGSVTSQRLTSVGKLAPKELRDWKVKAVSDGLRRFFGSQRLPHSVRDELEAYWSAFTLQIRTARNDAGHPTSVQPVTPDAVHASLLIFPELAKLANHLSTWVQTDLN